MNEERQRKIRRFIGKARTPYRAAVASVAMAAAFTATALHASEAITPQAIDRSALFSVLTRADAGESAAGGAAEIAPEAGLTAGLPESDITRIEREEEPSSPPDAEGTAGEGDDGVFPISRLDLSGSPGAGELLYSENETSFSPDLYALLGAGYPIEKERAPAVLIIHTHGTEAYSDGSGYYTDDTPFRSSDPARTVVAVGDAIADELEKSGVRCVHCTVMHDAEDFNAAYDRAAESIRKYLGEYPEIQYIIDVHRDAIIRGDGEMVAPTVDTPEGRAAQVMLVVGTDAYGADHPRWRDNLNVACKLQERLNADYNFARPINLRGASFNEQYRTGSMLLEVGACGNTLGEAELAGRLFARALSSLIKTN